jgi:diaminopimelate epimerase
MKHLTIPFAKLHGLGNDWIVVAGRDLSALRSRREMAAFARSITNRHEGVGADGLIVVLSSRSRRNGAMVRFFNADGSEAEMSGNGVRCAAAFIYAAGAVRPASARRPLRIQTLAGLKTIETVKSEKRKWVFRVGMGRPTLDPARIGFKAPHVCAPVMGYHLETPHGPFAVTVTSMGNPHCTVFVNDFDFDWAGVGSAIERNELFPRRTNVEFVKVISKKEIEVRFWERGVGRTQSSGTGSCAAVVACILNGLTGRTVRVQTEGGMLEVSWPDGREVTLTGPVEHTAQGDYYYVVQ